MNDDDFIIKKIRIIPRRSDGIYIVVYAILNSYDISMPIYFGPFPDKRMFLDALGDLKKLVSGKLTEEEIVGLNIWPIDEYGIAAKPDYYKIIKVESGKSWHIWVDEQ